MNDDLVKIGKVAVEGKGVEFCTPDYKDIGTILLLPLCGGKSKTIKKSRDTFYVVSNLLGYIGEDFYGYVRGNIVYPRHVAIPCVKRVEKYTIPWLEIESDDPADTEILHEEYYCPLCYENLGKYASKLSCPLCGTLILWHE